MSLDTLVTVNITAGARRITRQGFGTPLILAYHKHWTGRTRSYTSTTAMVSDGFRTNEPAYLMAQAAFSQSPRVPRVKIGRRDIAFSQEVELTPETPSNGKVYQIDVDGETYAYTAGGGDSLADVCTALADALNTADGIAAVMGTIATGGSTAGTQTLTGTSLNGTIGAENMDPPRRLAFTFNSHADWDSTTITVTGKDEDGVTFSEGFAVPNGGGDTVNGAYRFKSVTSISIPAQTGTNGTFTLAVQEITSRAEPDAIIRRGASTAGTQTLDDETELNGSVGGDVFDRPRSLQITFNEHAHWDATTIAVNGKDEAGDDVSENFSVPNGGNSVVTGAVVFTQVTSVEVPTQSGTAGTFTLGFNPMYTADGSSGTKVVVTTTDDGQLVSYENWYDLGQRGNTLAVADVTEDPGIATDLAAIRLVDSDWYGLLIDSNSQEEIEEAAAWAEAQKVLMAIQSGDSLIMDSESGEDVFSQLKLSSYARTVPLFHPSIAAQWMAAGALCGRLPRDPGSYTWKFKSVPGVESYSLTDSQKSAIIAKNGNTYTETAGVAIIEEGTTASGEFADITRFVDWQVAQIQEGIYFLLLNNEKLPYTDASVSLVKNNVLSKLKKGIRVGGLRNDPFPIVTAPKVADMDAEDRAARILTGIEFSAELAGAIHKLTLSGTLSV